MNKTHTRQTSQVGGCRCVVCQTQGAHDNNKWILHLHHATMPWPYYRTFKRTIEEEDNTAGECHANEAHAIQSKCMCHNCSVEGVCVQVDGDIDSIVHRDYCSPLVCCCCCCWCCCDSARVHLYLSEVAVSHTLALRNSPICKHSEFANHLDIHITCTFDVDFEWRLVNPASCMQISTMISAQVHLLNVRPLFLCTYQCPGTFSHRST